jgi:hypothetical protein
MIARAGARAGGGLSPLSFALIAFSATMRGDNGELACLDLDREQLALVIT